MSLSLVGFSVAPPSAFLKNPREAAFAFVFGSAVFAAVMWLPGLLRDPDTLWHITTGEWILVHRAVQSVDTFSFTAEGRPWVAQEWLSEVILALVYRGAGWTGVMILMASAAGSVIGIVTFHLRQYLRADIALMMILLTAACACPSLLARPHLLALPCLALWTVTLVSARARSVTPPFWLLPLMTVWANLHGGFIMGLMLAGAFAVEAAFDPACRGVEPIRRWGLFVAGAALAAAITPHGIDGLLFPFRLLAMKDLNQIQEWQPTDLGHLSGVTGAILLALYLGLTGHISLPRFRALMLIGLVFVMMQHVRNAQVFGVVAPLLFAGSLGRPHATSFHVKYIVPMRMLGAAVMVAASISLILRVEVPLQRTDDGRYASVALDHVPAALRSKPVLNEYGFGGLLIFAGIRPFIDGRADLYGDSFLDTYFAITRAKGNALNEALCRYGIEWTIFPPDTVVPALMDRTPGWHRLYSDKLAIIHVRDNQAGTKACSISAAPGIEPDAQGASEPR